MGRTKAGGGILFTAISHTQAQGPRCLFLPYDPDIHDYVVAVADTGGGTQDIDSPLFANIDPVGAIVLGSHSNAIDNLHDHHVISAGMVAAQGGTPVEWCSNIFHEVGSRIFDVRSTPKNGPKSLNSGHRLPHSRWWCRSEII